MSDALDHPYSSDQDEQDLSRVSFYQIEEISCKCKVGTLPGSKRLHSMGVVVALMKTSQKRWERRGTPLGGPSAFRWPGNS
jgi:hypothetical protein